MLGLVDVGDVTDVVPDDESVDDVELLKLDNETLDDDTLDVWEVLEEEEIDDETGAAPGILSGPGVYRVRS